MAVLVTGGAGFIGSHTCIALLEAGEEIVILDNFANSKPRAVELIRELSGKGFTFYEADLLDEPALDRIFVAHSIDAVIHFAGLKAVGESVRLPLSYYHNNITGTLLLCRAMAKAGVKRMVFSSSATVYGDPATVPITEDFPLSATNPYGATKLMIERILTDIAAAEGWSVALLRYFNPIGAHKSGSIGEDPQGIPNNLLPFIARVAAGTLPELSVFGDDYPTPDGTGVRDYIHVCDLAAGHLSALGYVREHTGTEAFNLGTGQGYSVLDVLHAFERACGKTIPYRISPRRPGDIPACMADASKAERELHWKAERGVDEMCEDAWRFVQNNPNGL